MSAIDEWIRRIEHLLRQGQLQTATDSCRALLADQPGAPRAWVALGVGLLLLREFSNAAVAFRSAVQLNPSDANSWHHLSVALQEAGQLAEAEECSQKALAQNDADPAFWLQLGNVLYRQERFADAAEAYRKAACLSPFDTTAWNNLGSAEHVQHRLPEAQHAYESSLALAPSQPQTCLKLALIFELQWSLCQAEELARRAAAVDERSAEAWAILGRILLARGKQGEAEGALQRSFLLQPSVAAHSRLLQCAQYANDVTAERLLAMHKEWNANFAQGAIRFDHRSRSSKRADERLRIGFVSAEFGITPTGFFVLPLLQHLDKSQCTVACYSASRGGDSLTPQFRAASDIWRVTCDLTAEQLARQIYDDRIDVLVDLMGHFGNRLPVFAYKPAPVQITWFGYVGTTGIQAIDFILADRFHIRSGEEQYYTEIPLRMPNGYACYQPPSYAPRISPLPALTSGHVSFGCFNNPAKYSDGILRAWSEILHRVPHAQLLLKYGGLHEPGAQEWIRGRIAEHGIDPRRIQCEGWSPHQELLADYGRVDLALDTQPYSGGLTTCEALWMGVPTVTFPGTTFAGRHSTSHMTCASYPQFVAGNCQDYIETAVHWASQLDELAFIRSQMRAHIAQSALCDATRFAYDFLHTVVNVFDKALAERVFPQDIS